MGVETELLGLKNRYDGKEFRVIEREDGTIAVLAGDVVITDTGKVPVTATLSDQGLNYSSGDPVPGVRYTPGTALVMPFERTPVGQVATLSIPNPYPAQANAPVHPALLFFPTGWNGYRYWMAFTPYPAYDSTYENPCVVSSNDLVTWGAPAANPLVPKPAQAGGYNADTHLFMSPDNVTMYLAFRERGVGGQNVLKIMHTIDGRVWTPPVSVLSGAVGTQDFASPSIWWNGTSWTLISHNLDASAPWPIQRRVSATANVYGSWGTPTTVTPPAPATRAWWHSFATKLPSDQIIALLQDNNGTTGTSGTLYFAESADDGATWSGVRQVYRPGGKYRSTYCLERVDGATQLRVIAGNFTALTLEMFVLREARVSADTLAERIRAIIGGANLGLPGVLWADTFVRADSTTSVGVADSGGAYTVSSGTWGISGNAAYPVASGRLLVDVGTSAYRMSVRILDMTTGVQQWAVFRAASGADYWRLGVSPPTAAGPQLLYLQSIVSGSVGVSEVIGAIARGQYLSVETVPGGFRVYVDGVLQHERATPLYGAAQQIGLQANAGALTKYSNLVCEAL